jgi:hypothetical protein
MFDHRINLRDNKSKRTSPKEMARKLYLSFPTCNVATEPEVEYEIRNKYANSYDVPLSCVQLIGSGKTGFSLVKNTEFTPGRSDLDLAVIDQRLFARLWEEAHQASNGFEPNRFTDPVIDGQAIVGGAHRRFLDYLARGIIAPDFLPSGSLRQRLIGNADRISGQYRNYFKKTSAFFYASEYFFQLKQQDAILKHWENL